MQTQIKFPKYQGVRCLMMPYIQGEPESIPEKYGAYADILNELYFKKGDVGYLTIDESPAKKGTPHRGDRAKHGRALHTEGGKLPGGLFCWGPSPWGGRINVLLERTVKVMLANSLDDSCAIWDAEHVDTSLDGDIGYASDLYPYKSARMLKAGEVAEIGIFTPHESLPAAEDFNRQFLRIISSGVRGREPYFTENPLMGAI